MRDHSERADVLCQIAQDPVEVKGIGEAVAVAVGVRLALCGDIAVFQGRIVAGQSGHQHCIENIDCT